MHVWVTGLLFVSAAHAAPITMMSSLTTTEVSSTAQSDLLQPWHSQLGYSSLDMSNNAALLNYYSLIGSHVGVMDALVNVLGEGHFIYNYSLMNSNLWSAWSTPANQSQLAIIKSSVSAFALIFAPVFMSFLIIRRRLK